MLLIEMGHTHYNELANDGHIIYATTRSTGQIEEGPPGFSVTTLDDGVVSWKFKPIGERPLVMVTSPADQRLVTDSMNPAQVICDQVQVCARVWGDMMTAKTEDNRSASDTILALVNRPGQFEWPAKDILGTQLGPNENGHHWPSRRGRRPSRRERARQPR